MLFILGLLMFFKADLKHFLIRHTLHFSREGALVLLLWEKTHVLTVMGSNPSAVYWMDIFSHKFVVKNVLLFVLKRPKINEKRPGKVHYFFAFFSASP